MKKRILILSCFLFIFILLFAIVVFTQDEKTKVKKDLDISLLKSLIVAGKPENTNEIIVKMLFEKTKYEIISVEDGVCEIKLTYPDAKKLLFEIIDKEGYDNNNKDETENLI